MMGTYFDRQWSNEAVWRKGWLLHTPREMRAVNLIKTAAHRKYKSVSACAKFLADFEDCLMYALEDEPHNPKPIELLSRRAKERGFWLTFRMEWNRLMYKNNTKELMI